MLGNKHCETNLQEYFYYLVIFLFLGSNFLSSFRISMLISAPCMSVADSLNPSFLAKFCAYVVIAVNSLDCFGVVYLSICDFTFFVVYEVKHMCTILTTSKIQKNVEK